jgi:AcrR family transcriptional regulator
MGISERKEREKKEMEKLILDSAMQLFIDEGYKNVTIRRLAEKIEYSPATIYLYFKDKDEILFTLQRMAFEKFHNFQASIQTIIDPVERLTEHGKAYVRFALENREYYELMFLIDSPMKQESLNDYKAEIDSYQLLKDNLQSCMDAGIMKPIDIEIAAFSMWSYVHGIASIIIKRGFLIPEDIQKNLVDGALNFLASNYVSKK